MHIGWIRARPSFSQDYNGGVLETRHIRRVWLGRGRRRRLPPFDDYAREYLVRIWGGWIFVGAVIECSREWGRCTLDEEILRHQCAGDFSQQQQNIRACSTYSLLFFVNKNTYARAFVIIENNDTRLNLLSSDFRSAFQARWKSERVLISKILSLVRLLFIARGERGQA